MEIEQLYPRNRQLWQDIVKAVFLSLSLSILTLVFSSTQALFWPPPFISLSQSSYPISSSLTTPSLPPLAISLGLWINKAYPQPFRKMHSFNVSTNHPTISSGKEESRPNGYNKYNLHRYIEEAISPFCFHPNNPAKKKGCWGGEETRALLSKSEYIGSAALYIFIISIPGKLNRKGN